MPFLEKPPPCTSQVLIKRCMSKIFLSLTSLEDALLRLPHRRQKTPSGLTWGTSPRRGTYHLLLSSLALACSFCSISLSDSECSLLLSVSLLLFLLFCLVCLSGLYPIPLMMLLYFNLVMFCVLPLALKCPALLALCAEDHPCHVIHPLWQTLLCLSWESAPCHGGAVPCRRGWLRMQDLLRGG
jgi:hypothetical protein